mgnify:CR=1 FL=1
MTDSNVTRLQKRIANAAYDMMEADSESIVYLHALLCHVGLPRRQTDARAFERASGGAGIRIEAGSVLRSKGWVPAPLPYGTKPRLVLMHLCAEAVRTKSPEIDIGHSLNDFLAKLGIDNNGRAYGRFRSQMEALAVCRMQFGFVTNERSVMINTQPISQFEAWVKHDHGTPGLWPGALSLSAEFYQALIDHAVPLDPRAISALQGSALSLDIYTWLAHRLCRIRKDNGIPLYWKNLRDQFGQEYKESKDFKREFLKSMSNALSVYPDAKVEQVTGGIKLYPSPPPIKKNSVVVKSFPTSIPSLNVSEKALETVRLVAPGWDKYALLADWREWHLNKDLVSPTNPDKAFLAWAKKYTKGKAPI